MPIKVTAEKIFTFPTIAREMPTASASMDVATAMTNMVFIDKSAPFSQQHSSSLDVASLSIFTPMMASKPKAIQ